MMVKGDHHLLQGDTAFCPKPPVDIFHKSNIALSKPSHFQQKMKLGGTTDEEHGILLGLNCAAVACQLAR